MPLVAVDRFEEVFAPLLGKSIGFIRPVGNVGDDLITMATFQMLDHFGVDWREVTPENAEGCDELIFGGGGNMGRRYQNNWDLRTRCLQTGLPLTILPQSFTTPENRPFHRVYVRERASLKLYPRATLAPDLALGLDYTTDTEPMFRRGVFLRRDIEAARKYWFRWFRRDPVRMCRTPVEYLELAAQYEEIITDRLHFAICGLTVGRRVTLIRNSYHKNASLHETWLNELGCRFADSVLRAA